MSNANSVPRALRPALAALVFLAACSQAPEPAAPTATSPEPEPAPSLAGEWRAVLSSPGGELPFQLLIEGEPGDYRAAVMNGTERVPFSTVERVGDGIMLRYDWYDAEIEAEVSTDASVLRGRWRKTAAGGVDSELPFTATRGIAARFLPTTEAAVADAPADISGRWAVTFVDDDGKEEPAVGEFVQTDAHVAGTFLTPTGDYRFLEGSFENGHLRLSTFDGAHAFLFAAAVDASGGLTGDFWSRDTYHATWTAQRNEAAALPDSWDHVAVTTDDGRIAFRFENVDGAAVSLEDPAFAGRPVVVNLFGTWCPNCNDEAPLMADWHREFAPQGLGFVGLAFEYTGDVSRDRDMVRRYAERHGIDYPLLLAGTSDKVDAAEALGFVDQVFAYPTTLFLDASHTVVAIHSGFAGPGTGTHHDEVVAELRDQLAAMVATAPDQSAADRPSD
ncbi:MAG: TlpA disulfide reductase family protein [Pseudomonadota bacterium]